MSEATIEYKNSPNESTAYAVSEGQKTKVQLVATPAGDLELADNPNVDTGYLTVEGKKHKVKLVAQVDGDLEFPNNTTSKNAYVITSNGKKHRVTMTANVTGGGTTINNQDITVTENGTYTADEGYTGLGTVEVQVPTGGGSASKYGVSIDNFLGDVDADGLLLPPESFNLTVTGIKRLYESSRFAYIFEHNASVRDVVFPDLEFIANEAMSYSFAESSITSVVFSKLADVGNNGLNRTFYKCVDLISAAFPALISGVSANSFYQTFFGCTGLVTVDLSVWEKIGATYQIFYNCTGLKNVKLDSLKAITGIMSGTFFGCTGLERIDFPALISVTSDAFGSGTSTYSFRSCTQEGLEIHFRADMQATIEALTGYSAKWGATNATIYFDL